MTDVWKTTETQYYSVALKNRNAYGSFTTAKSRKVITWSARVGDRVVRGFTTKRSAVAATKA